MKKYLIVLLLFLFQNSVTAQMDFVLNNPTMGPVTPAPFPGNLTISFDFYVAQSSFTFSSDPFSNNYATITFSFTKLNPTGISPSGTGSTLFNWVLTNNGGVGVNRVYTYTGTTKNIVMLQSPPAPKYQIKFENVPITFEATQAQSDVRVAGEFTNPGAAPPGLSANNSSSISTYTTSAAAPVKLLSFNAQKHGDAVNLIWQTASEQNSNYFDVQFSKNGSIWQSIGRVQATGNSNTLQNYALIHATPVKGINYYRLKQVDRDDKFVFSEVRVVNFNSKGLITVLPNPVSDRVYITSGNGDSFQSIRVITSEGKQIQQFSNFISGNSINMNSYPAGTYIIQMTDKNGNAEVTRVVKQ